MKNLNIDDNNFATATENDTVRHYLLMVFFILLGRLRDKTYQLEGLVLDYAKKEVVTKIPFYGVTKFEPSLRLTSSCLPTTSTTTFMADKDVENGQKGHTKPRIVRTKKSGARLGFKVALVATIWVAFAAYTHKPTVDTHVRVVNTKTEAKNVAENHHGIAFSVLGAMNYTMDRMVDTKYDGVDPFRFHHTTDIKTTTPIKHSATILDRVWYALTGNTESAPVDEAVKVNPREAAELANKLSEDEGLQDCYTFHDGFRGFVRLKCTGYSIPTADELEQITQGHRDENELDERSSVDTIGTVRFVLNK